MDRKAIFIALGLAVLGAVCLFVYMRRFEAETSGGPKVAVLIATRDIPIGVNLQPNMMGIRQIPQAYIEQRHILVSDMETVRGARMSMAVHANEAILWSDLASMQLERRDLSGLIEPGLRGMTISTRGSGGGNFGGLLRPGDRVDVLHTPTRGGSSVTITLLQNVVVLAVGSDTGSGEARGAQSRAVTVSLGPEQAQLVLHASTQGPLDVVLRNPDDVVVLKDLPEIGEADIREPERRARLAMRRIPSTQVAVQPAQPPAAPPRKIERVTGAR